MKTSEIMTMSTSDDFLAKAFTEYAQDRQEAYAEFYANVSSGIADIIDHIDDDGNLIGTINDYVDSWMLKSGFDRKSNMQLQGKVVPIREFMGSAVRGQLQAEAKGLDDASQMVFNVTALGGDVGVEEVFTEMKNTLHALTVSASAALASVGVTVSEKLTVFRDNISRVFGNAYDDVSGAMGYLTDMLTRTKTSTEFMSTYFASTAMDGPSDEFIPEENTDFYQFTGASPSGAFNFDSLEKGIATTVEVASKIVKSAVKGFVSLIPKVFNPIKKFIVETVVDPYDIQDSGDKNASLTIDGFAYYGKSDVSTVNARIGEEMVGRRFQYDFIAGDVYIEFDKTMLNTTRLGYKYSIKPKPLFQPGGFNTVDFRGWTVPQMIDYIKTIKNQSIMYADTSSKEVDLYRAFNFGTFMMGVISAFAIKELHESTGKDWTLSNGPGVFDIEWVPKTSVTNMDFVQAACGLVNPTDKKQIIPGVKLNPLGVSASGFVNWIVLQMQDKLSNPLDYFFVPYVSRNVERYDSRYSIKTDEQNQQHFNKMLTIAIVIVVVVVVAASAAVAIKRFSRTASLRASAMKREMEQKALDGTLTSKDLRRLRRAQRKASLFSSSNEGLVSNITNSFKGSQAQSDSAITDIRKLLK